MLALTRRLRGSWMVLMASSSIGESVTLGSCDVEGDFIGMRGLASGDDGVVVAMEERERTWPFCGRGFEGEERETM